MIQQSGKKTKQNRNSKDVNPNVHSSTIHDNQDMEAT